MNIPTIHLSLFSINYFVFIKEIYKDMVDKMKKKEKNKLFNYFLPAIRNDNNNNNKLQ